jgi:hypothetical protein
LFTIGFVLAMGGFFYTYIKKHMAEDERNSRR